MIMRARWNGRAQLVDDGADIIDIGGESTRPGALPVPVSVELDRVIRLVEDTGGRRHARQRRHVEAGRHARDRPGGRLHDQRRAGVASAGRVGRGGGMRRGRLPHAHAGRAALDAGGHPLCRRGPRGAANSWSGVRPACEAAGIARDRIVIDPGLGFGKAVAHNLSLLHSLDVLAATGYPVLAGMSRKSTLGAITGPATFRSGWRRASRPRWRPWRTARRSCACTTCARRSMR